jgi:hypothetical protein
VHEVAALSGTYGLDGGIFPLSQNFENREYVRDRFGKSASGTSQTSGLVPALAVSTYPRKVNGLRA